MSLLLTYGLGAQITLGPEIQVAGPLGVDSEESKPVPTDSTLVSSVPQGIDSVLDDNIPTPTDSETNDPSPLPSDSRTFVPLPISSRREDM